MPIKNKLPLKAVAVPSASLVKTNVFDLFEYDYRTSVIRNLSGEVAFEMTNVEVPKQWSQIATVFLPKSIFVAKAQPMEVLVVKHPQKKHTAWRIAGEWVNVMILLQKRCTSFLRRLVFILNQMWFNSLQWFNGL
jgi:ribonucleoside-diphosphate reductase alpha chain